MPAPWIRGGKFKIRYRLPGQRYDRELVALYLGRNNMSPGTDRPFQFSGRPEFGTFNINRVHILDNERVDDDATCYMDRRAPS